MNLQEIEERLDFLGDEMDKYRNAKGMDEFNSYQQYEDYHDKDPNKKEYYNLERQKRLLMVPKMEPLDNMGDLMSLKSFISNVEDGGFINYDGFGNYATEKEESNITIHPSDVKHNSIRKDFTHIVWYNK